jgi:hypothetical protein
MASIATTRRAAGGVVGPSVAAVAPHAEASGRRSANATDAEWDIEEEVRMEPLTTPPRKRSRGDDACADEGIAAAFGQGMAATTLEPTSVRARCDAGPRA